jgi:5-methylcytosine-specific restriction endonuclease McrA
MIRRLCLGVEGRRCGNLTTATRCDGCRRAHQRLRSASRPRYETRIYSSAAWQRLRAQVLAEERACAWCGTTTRPLTAGHIRSLRQYPELALERDNVRASCRSCQNLHQHRSAT